MDAIWGLAPPVPVARWPAGSGAPRRGFLKKREHTSRFVRNPRPPKKRAHFRQRAW